MRKLNTSANSTPSSRSVVVSNAGATLRVERIELSDADRQSLTTRAGSIGQQTPVSKPGVQQTQK